HQPAVEERRADGVVLAGELNALLQRACGVTRLEPDVPESAVEVLGGGVRPAAAGIPFSGKKGEQVDVRARSELAATVAAGRDQGERDGVGAGNLGEDGAEQ